MNCSAAFIAALRSEVFAFGPVGKGHRLKKLFHLYEKICGTFKQRAFACQWETTHKEGISVTFL